MKQKEKKPKEDTIKFWKDEMAGAEKNLEEINTLPKEVQELFNKAHAAKDNYYKSVRQKREETNSYINHCEKRIEQIQAAKQLSIPSDVDKWFHKYVSGVDWGYNSPKIIHVSSDNQFVIVRSSGGTAGTGTAMGAGSYYYAKTQHWIAQVNGPKYIDWNNSQKNEACAHYGRLSKIHKELMLQYIDECISGERDYSKDPRNTLARTFPEAFTSEEAEQSNEWA